MANENVLRSYLISLGYAIDEDGYRKFKANLQDTSKKMQELGLAAIAAATELTASVIKISSNLERLYFASQRTGATAKNIQALEFGAKQIGVSAEEATGALESMAAALRTSPGLVGYLKALNINPNQDGVQLLLDLVDRLRHMPRGTYYQQAAIASMFGIDEKTLFMLEKNFDELKKQMEINKKVNPIDDTKIKKFHEFMERVRELTNRLEILANIVAARFVPILDATLPYLTAFIDKLIALDAATGGWSSILVGLAAALTSVYGAAKALQILGGFLGIGSAAEGAGVLATVKGLVIWLTTLGSAAIVSGITAIWLTTRRWHDELAGIQDIYHNILEYIKSPVGTIKKMFSEEEYDPELRRKGITQHDSPEQRAIRHLVHTLFPSISENLPGQATTPAPPVTGSVSQLLDFYSKKFGLDPGLVRALVHQESRGNQNAISKKGAIGIMQLMPETAKQLKVDPFNLQGNIEGGTHMLADLMRLYKGNESLALAAYNAGTKAVDKYHGVPPFAETQDYVKQILDYKLGHDPYNANLISNASNYRLSQRGAAAGSTVTINQDTKIDVTGTGDPRAVGDQVLKGQRSVNADIVRNVGGNHR
jgi:hypothetical protein